MPNPAQRLDLYSTSQTHSWCAYGAPLVALVIGGKATISQGCCNHWDCPACGIVRAKQEYRRIVFGAEQLSREGHKLYFWTLTCRGREMPLKEAEDHYLEWTNILLTNARVKARRANDYWCYVQVTERQKKTRNHPHSHLITTYLPVDAIETTNAKGKPCFVSEWFSRANFTAGLGSQHEITLVKSAAAVARYVGKYLFKQTMTDKFPSNWKRVRYSQNYPTPPKMTPDFAIPLLSPKDWQAARRQGVRYVCADATIFQLASHHIDCIRL